MGTPVWEHDGIICTGETYKSVVKMTFAKGASLPDPRASSIQPRGQHPRAIDVREGERSTKGVEALIRDAVVLNHPGPTLSARCRTDAAMSSPSRE